MLFHIYLFDIKHNYRVRKLMSRFTKLYLIFRTKKQADVKQNPAFYYPIEYFLYLHDVRIWTHYTITWAPCIQGCVPLRFVVPSDLKTELCFCITTPTVLASSTLSSVS